VAERRALPRASALALLASIALLGGCGRYVETDQARLCRMALPALESPDAQIRIVEQRANADNRGVAVDFANGLDAERHSIQCRFRAAGRPDRAEDLRALILDDVPLDDVKRYFLVRFWLATPEGRAADPAPLGDVSALPEVPSKVAYLLQQAINGLPLTAVYALLAAAYSLVYGLVGRINLAFGALAAAGGYGAALGATLMAGGSPAPILGLALVYAAFVAATWGFASSRWVFLPLASATGQIALVATIGLAVFLDEFLRLTQGTALHWVSPVLNQPFGVARGGDFIVTTALNAWLAVALAVAAGLALLALMRGSEFGRHWRAYSDDPFAAQLMGIDPGVLFALALTLASGLAGVAGFVMTMFYGAVGYGAATGLGLKALAAAVVGGVGSIPGAFLGGLLIGGFEALWSAYFSADYRDVAVFALLAILLALRPRGILGVESGP